jgi:hypothetical protein
MDSARAKKIKKIKMSKRTQELIENNHNCSETEPGKNPRKPGFNPGIRPINPPELKPDPAFSA